MYGYEFQCVCIAKTKSVVVFVSLIIRTNLSSMVWKGEFLSVPLKTLVVIHYEKNCWFTKVASWYAPPDKTPHCQLSPCCDTIRVMWEVIWAHWEGWLDLATSVLSNLTIWQNSPLSSSCNSTREIWAHWEGWFGEMNLYQHQLFCHIWQNSPLTSSCNREMWEVIWVHWEGWLGIGLLSWMFGHRRGIYSIIQQSKSIFGHRLGGYFSKSSAKINFGYRPGRCFYWLKLTFEICASIKRCLATDQVDIFIFIGQT